MDLTASITKKSPQQDCGHIGRIPLRNLWLLMFYASGLFRQLNRGKVAVEENPEDIPDLVAELLAHLVERRLKRNLSYGYQSKSAALNRVRGHINPLETECHQFLLRGKVSCRFEELTVDTPRNRYVRGALERICRIVRRPELAHRCWALAGSLKRIGVTGDVPIRYKVPVERCGYQGIDDQLMVTAAHLAFNLMLPTEAAGGTLLPLPEREIIWVRHLYEKAVAGFYDVVLPKPEWRIDAGRTIRWPICSKTSGIEKILPSMRTDIVLDHQTTKRRIVIDTKFTSILTKGWYKEDTLRSGYIYQIYAYLRSQENNDDPLAADASGILLHPSIDEMVDEAVVIQGHAIRFATINLGASAIKIREQLLQVIEFPPLV